jgi:hypothetical protein
MTMNPLQELLGWSMPVLLIACGGMTSTQGTQGGHPDGASTGFGSCTILAGTYAQHFTAEDGGTFCPNPPDLTVIVNANETFTVSGNAMSGMGGTGAADAGQGFCTSDWNSSTCTHTSTCKLSIAIDDGGRTYTTLTSSSFTIDGGSGTGKETFEQTSPFDSTSCTYDFSLTKN